MPGYLIQQGATVLCAHGGQATATVPNPRGHGGRHAHRSCWPSRGSRRLPGVPPPVPPCVTGQWVTGDDPGDLGRPAAGHRRRRGGLRPVGDAAAVPYVVQPA